MKSTLPEMFFETSVKFNPDKNIFYTKIDDEYIPKSFEEFLNDIYKVTLYFRSAGIGRLLILHAFS